MAFAGRPESFLPSIKCSSCGGDIPMDALADHICTSATPAQPKSTRNFFDRLGATAGSALNNIQHNAPFAPKFGWSNPPPRIDPTAASQSNREVEPHEYTLTSADQSFHQPPSQSYTQPYSNNYASPQTESPATPYTDLKSPGARIYDASTPHTNPYSDRSTDNDLSYPPYPSRYDDAAQKLQPTRKASPIDAPSSGKPYAFPERVPEVPPANIRQNVLKRLDTVAPGPFSQPTHNREPSMGMSVIGSRHQRNKTSESVKDFFRHQRTSEALKRPTTANADRKQDIYTDTATANPFSRSRSDSAARKDDPYTSDRYEASSPPRPKTSHSHKPSRGVSSIDDFLNSVDVQSPPRLQSHTRQPSQPKRDLSFNPYGYSGTQAEENVTLLKPLTYTSSVRDKSRTDARLKEAPPVPPVSALQRQFPGVAASHSPTDSSSSGGSDEFSSHASQSSRSSPPGSDLGDWSRRPSDTSTHGVMVSASSSLGEREKVGLGIQKPLPTPMEHPVPTARQRSNTASSRDRSMSLRRPSHDVGAASPPLPALPVEFSPATSTSASTFSAAGPRRPSAPDVRRPSPSNYNPSPSAPSPPRKARTPVHEPGWHPPRSDLSTAPVRSRSNPTTPFSHNNSKPLPSIKPPCRGCGTPITGRAIRATDGRLTGRWHKECFTCQTCHAPFPTADFYVHNDRPYCERHWHHLNGSLCTGCGEGIEGVYLQTDFALENDGSGGKFHKGCFKCGVCDIPLRDEYYEVKGGSYCERHAWSVAQKHEARGGTYGSLSPERNAGSGGAAGGSRFMQKRTTRLMDMGFGGLGALGGGHAGSGGFGALPSLSENAVPEEVEERNSDQQYQQHRQQEPQQPEYRQQQQRPMQQPFGSGPAPPRDAFPNGGRNGGYGGARPYGGGSSQNGYDVRGPSAPSPYGAGADRMDRGAYGRGGQFAPMGGAPVSTAPVSAPGNGSWI